MTFRVIGAIPGHDLVFDPEPPMGTDYHVVANCECGLHLFNEWISDDVKGDGPAAMKAISQLWSQHLEELSSMN